MITTAVDRVGLRAKVMNPGTDREFVRVYLHCECGTELASWPVDNLVRWDQVNYAQCAQCRGQTT